MTSDASRPREAFVWTWLPGRSAPVVAGRVRAEADHFVFNYGRSYLARGDAIPIYLPELPLRSGAIAPDPPLEIANDDFEPDPDFDLRAFARRSFGTWQDAPVKVALRFDARAAPDAATFLFHPDQTATENADGTVTIRFEAGGLDEMCWHLVTWGDTVTIEKPARLRRKLSKMCETLAAHHG